MISTDFRRPAAAAAAALVLAICCSIPAALADATPPPLSIDISHFAFAPKEVTVAPGTKVVWTNHDDTPHAVTGEDKSFASKGLDTGDKYEHTFSLEGDFAYHCAVHPYMTGVVHVRRQ